MNNGWIKLHRKAQASEIWQDQTAWRIFQWFLMNVDYSTGKGTFGKKQISEGTGVKLGTVYKVVTRLQNKYSVLSTKSSHLYTQISVLNWAKYQHSSDDGVSTVQSEEPVAYKKSNTIKEVKNIRNKEYKREKENTSLNYLENIPEEDFVYFTKTWDLTRIQLQKKAQQLADYCLAHGKKYKDYKAFLRNAVSRDFKVRPAQEPTVVYEYDSNGLARLKELKVGFAIKNMISTKQMTDEQVNDRRNYLDRQSKELRN